ncbi:hypothetical protein VD659_07915 [Herbiconiux sp. 11R-BC]|uniref:hypothetical protein n=1 Tax=Herbiconiux sp. 11R-BC TaxID=3111637 RepID=UPI003C03F28C
MPLIIKHSLRIQLDSFGGYRPEGWCPRVGFTLLGPVPAGAVLEWTVTRPDGAVWFSGTARLREAAADERIAAELRHGEDGCDEAGTFGLRIRLVSALDGVDELLHDGSFTVTARGGEHLYAVDNSWLGGLGLVSLDTAGLADAPRLRATAFLPGDAQAYQLEAHCFFRGVRLPEPASVATGWAGPGNDGEPTLREVLAEFDAVRGWNNDRASGWGSGWHLLDENDGPYEVVFLRDSTVVRRVPFEVTDGRIVATGPIEPGTSGGPVLVVEAHDAAGPAGSSGAAPARGPAGSGGSAGTEALAGTDGRAPAIRTTDRRVPDGEAPDSAAYYGDPVTAAARAGIDEVYADRAPVAAEASGAAAAADATDDPAVRAFVDRAERLLQTWEHDMTTTAPPFGFAQTLAADAVLRENDDYLPLAAAVASVPDSASTTIAGVPVTIGELRSRVESLFAAARSRLEATATAEEDALAPYRAALAGDKLRIFEEHPAGTFEYLTTGRAVIDTPEQLAGAEYWYFEGANDVSGTVSADGVQARVTAAGWRVVGWQFDADGTTVDHWEVQGTGTSAPLSAFRRE